MPDHASIDSGNFAMAEGDERVITKHAPLPVPAYLSEHMKVARLVETLEQLPFNSRDEGKVILDRVVRNYLVSASRAAADPDLTIHQALARRGAVRRCIIWRSFSTCLANFRSTAIRRRVWSRACKTVV
jgi:hypothetical protein